MAAPTKILTDHVPVGIPLQVGFRFMVVFKSYPALALWERKLKPLGVDGGPPIDTSTQLNAVVRTKHPRSLIDFTDMTFTCTYDPEAYDDIVSACNSNDLINISFPDDDVLAFFGWLQKWDPGEMGEDGQPEATVTVTASNWDPVNCVEALPVLIPATGTMC